MNSLRVKKLMPAETPSRVVLDCLSDIAFQVSKDWSRVEHLNLRAVELLGCTPNMSTGISNWHETLLARESRTAMEQFQRQLSDSSWPRERPLIGLKSVVGSNLPVQIHSVLVSEENWFLLANCVANEVAVEEVLRQTQARFRSIVDGLSISLLLKDLDGKIVYANQCFLDQNDWQLKDVLGKTDADIFPPELAAKFGSDDQAVIRTGEVLHLFEENQTATGRSYWAEVIKGPLRDADNRITGIQILFWDASERRFTEQALQLERHLLHTLLDNIPDSIYFKDRDSRFTRISGGMMRKFGFSDQSQVLGKSDADIFTGEHASQARIDELAIMRSQQPMIGFVEKETWKDRPDSWSSTTKLPLRNPDGEVVGTFGISRDVTELVKAEQQLREARDVADSANRAKSEFLANMSHEIRTPMNGIIGMTELLSHTRLTDAQRSFVSMIEQSAQSLLRIINDILDFSKIEAGKLDLENSSFDLRACVSQATKSLATRAAQQGTELILRIGRDIPDRLIGDEIRLRQILVNLIGNAVKFTTGGEITVRVSVADGPPAAELYSLHFSVTDTGIGIPAEKQKKIFEAFSQADVSTTRQYGGTGLGLSIASQLVGMMGGRIWLESEVGVGSIFHFTGKFAPDDKTQVTVADSQSLQHLPVLIVDDNATSRKLLAQSLGRRGLLVRETSSADDAERVVQLYASETPGPIVLVVDQIMPEVDGLQLIHTLHQHANEHRVVTLLLTTAAHPITEQQMDRFKIDALMQKPVLANEICESISRILHRNAETEPAGSEAVAQEPSQSRLRLLLAEDGAVNRAVFVGLLGDLGHEVTCVEDGEAAIEAWQEFDFDAIFMDVQMPVLDGLEATQRIRQLEPEGKHIPIIAVTAGAMAEDQQRCLQAGMDDYLSKPIEFKQLRSVLDTLTLHLEGRTSQWKDTTELPDTEQLSLVDSGPRTLNLDAPVAKIKCTAAQQRDLVATLKREIGQRIDEMATALDSQDDKLLVRASHSLKSAAALFEANDLVAVSDAIEKAARQGDTQIPQQHFGALREVAARALREIEQWLSGHSN